MSSLSQTALLIRLDLRSMSSNECTPRYGALSCWAWPWVLFGLDAPLLNEGKWLAWLNEGKSACWLNAGKSLWPNEGNSLLVNKGKSVESARGLEGTIDTAGLTTCELLCTCTRGGMESRGLVENDALLSDEGGLEVGDDSDLFRRQL